MNFVKRSILSLLALLVFATSSCFAVDVHMCEDKVQSQAFFTKAQACEKMDEMQKDGLRECCKKIRDAKIAKSSSKLMFKKKACCYNNTFEYKSDLNQDAQGAIAVVNTIDVILPLTFDYSIDLIDAEIVASHPMRGPPDPEIRRNIQSLYQVYII